MSALSSKADINIIPRDIRHVPILLKNSPVEAEGDR
jgi:hypothetical protein